MSDATTVQVQIRLVGLPDGWFGVHHFDPLYGQCADGDFVMFGNSPSIFSIDAEGVISYNGKRLVPAHVDDRGLLRVDDGGSHSVPLMVLDRVNGFSAIKAGGVPGDEYLTYWNCDATTIRFSEPYPIVKSTGAESFVQLYANFNGKWSPVSWSDLKETLTPAEAFRVPLDEQAEKDPVLGRLETGTIQHTTPGPYTVSAWVWLDSYISSSRTLLSAGRWTLFCKAGQVLLGNGPGATRALWPQKWAHIALVYDGDGHCAIYANGSRSVTFDAICYMSTISLGSPEFKGKLAQVALIDKVVLSEAAIRARIEREYPGYLSQSVLQLPLDGIQEIIGTDQKKTRSIANIGQLLSLSGAVAGAVAEAGDDLMGKVLSFPSGADNLPVANAIGNAEPGEGWRHLIWQCWVRIDAKRTGKGAMSLFWAGWMPLNQQTTKVHGFGIYADETTCSFRWAVNGTQHSLVGKPLPAGVWTHVAVCADGTSLGIYQNGVLDTRVDWDQVLPWGVPEHLGQIMVGGVTPLPSGEATAGFQGSLSRLTLHREIPADKTVQQMLVESIDRALGNVAVGRQIPLEFSLVNEDAEPVLVLNDEPQTLTLELKNTSGQMIDLPGPTSMHAVELRFRPGALTAPEQIVLDPQQTVAPGGAWAVQHRRDLDGIDVLVMHAATEDQLRPTDSVRIKLKNVLPDRSSGVRTARVQLRYHLSYDRRYPLEGSRVHVLSLVHPASQSGGSPELPLQAMIVGDAAVFCDGVTKNSLKIRVFNLSPEKIELSTDSSRCSKIRVILDTNDAGDGELWNNVPTALLRQDDINGVSVADISPSPGWGLETGKKIAGEVSLVNNSVGALDQAGSGKGSWVDFTLTMSTCHGDPGLAVLRLECINFGKPDKKGIRPSGFTSIPVRRTTAREASALETRVAGNVSIAQVSALNLYRDGWNAIDDGKVGGEVPTRLELRAPTDTAPEPTEAQRAAQVQRAEHLSVFAHDLTLAATNQLTLKAKTATVEGSMCVTQGISYDLAAGHPGYLVPKGAIIMWSGPAFPLPEGWILCDGSDNRAPDLSHRFIMGAKKDDPRDHPGAWGDAETHSHYVATSSCAASTNSDGAHRHNMGEKQQAKLDGDCGCWSWDHHGGWAPADGSDHSHSLTIPSLNGAAQDRLAGRPAWYAICFIMKT